MFNQDKKPARSGEEAPQEKKPVIDVIIRYDPRDGETNLTVVGGSISTDVVHAILDTAQNMLRLSEIEAARQGQEPGKKLAGQAHDSASSE